MSSKRKHGPGKIDLQYLWEVGKETRVGGELFLFLCLHGREGWAAHHYRLRLRHYPQYQSVSRLELRLIWGLPPLLE
jgi:hypothetical protein